jgi:NADH:ubiquinone oxidoreductase subunit H
MSFVVLLLLLGSSAMLLFLLSYTGLSKYSMLGCTRLISQFVAYELALTSLLVLLLWSYTDLCLANYSLFLQDFCTSYFTTTFAALAMPQSSLAGYAAAAG